MLVSRFIPRRAHRSPESGYVLLVLMLFVSLVLLATMATLPDLAQQIRRDREEEMIHRGTEYARAIQHFVKKFGRYPNTLDELKATNNLHFLRRAYVDPMTPDGKWKLLHMGDVKLDGAVMFGQPVAQAFGQPAAGLSSPVGGGPGGLSSPGGLTGLSTAGPGGFSLSAGTSGSSPDGSTAAAGAAATSNPAAGGDNSGTGSNISVGGSPGFTALNPTGNNTQGNSSSLLAVQFGGAAIIGVASQSEKEGLREFNDKTHYNEWYFVYDRTQDRGALLRGPYIVKQFSVGGGMTVGTPIGATTTPGGALGQQPGGSSMQPGGFGLQPTPQSPMSQPSH